MIEIFVMSMCIVTSFNGACGQATSAYYASKPEVQESLKKAEKRAAKITGNQAAAAMIPVVAVASGNDGKIFLDRHTNLVVNGRKSFIGLEWNF